MFFKTTSFVILLLLLTFCFVTYVAIHNFVHATSIAATQINKTFNNFIDPKSGISFKYPTDWHVASKEYTNALFGRSTTSLYNGTLSNLITPIALVLPDSLDGTNFIVLTEILPYPMSAEKYLEQTKKQSFNDPSLPMNNITHVSVGGLNGFKYDVVLPQNIIQTQMTFVKGSTGYDMAYIVGNTNKSKDTMDVHSMINSLRINK